MKGKLHYRIKDRSTMVEQNWVKDFTSTWQLFLVLYKAVKLRAETIHLYYQKAK